MCFMKILLIAALTCTYYMIHTRMKNTNNLQITTHTVSRSFLKKKLVLYRTTPNLLCTDFYVYFPKTSQSTVLKTLYNVPQLSRSCPKNITPFALRRHSDGKAAGIFENGTVAEGRGPLS